MAQRVTPRRLALLVALIGAAGVGRAAEAPLVLTPVQQQRAGITVTELAAGGGKEEGAGLRLSGRVVVPNEGVELSLSGIQGRLESVKVQVGQRVAAGAELGRLYSAELLGAQRAWLAARSQAALAAARTRRDEELLSAGVIASSRLDATRAEQMVAEAAAREQRQLLRLAGMGEREIDALRTAENMSPGVVIRARRAGVVLEQLAEIGAAVEPGTPLFRLGVLDTLWVDLQATPAQARGLAAGDAVRLIGCETARGRLLATGAQLSSATQTVVLRAEFRSAGACLLPNQFVDAEVHTRAVDESSVLAPAGALVQRGGQDYVFVQTPAGFVPTPVTISGPRGEMLHLMGVAPGQKIATGGVAALKGAWLGLGPEPR